MPSNDFAASALYSIGVWTLNTHTNQLLQDDRVVELEYRLTSLLVFLLQNKDRVLTKDDILKAVWQKKVVNDDSVAVAISQLRKALDDNPRTPTYIKTIPGIGYQFILRQEPEAQAPETGLQPESPSQTAVRPTRLIYTLLAILVTAAYIGYVWFGADSANPNSINPGAVALRSQDVVAIPAPTLDIYAQATQHLASFNPDDLRSAVKLFKQEIEKNPVHGQAYLGVAEAKIKLLHEQVSDSDSYAEIVALLNKALELDPTLARAHMWLGALMFAHGDNLLAVDGHFNAGIAAAPNNDELRYRYAHYLLIQKRFAHARAQINAARTINPLNYSRANMVWFYLLAGDNERALQELNRIESTEGRDRAFRVAEQNVYYSLGNEQKTYENMQWFFKEAGFDQKKVARLDQSFAEGGLSAVYKWLLDNKETADVGQYTPPIAWARYAVATGQKKLALDYLEQAFAKHQAHSNCTLVDPRYAPLHNDARFQTLLGKFNFPVFNP
jgi:DNA-binding winged helix-turn-helix (wHTH) protein/Flp pilus assembly protein TadD